MLQIYRFRTLLHASSLFITVFTLVLFVCPDMASGTEWKAGAASVSVTPDKPVWMAGYGDRDKPSEGKIHDLYVKALALEDGEGNKAVIVTADLIGMLMDFSNRVSAIIEKKYGIPRSAILFNASHTHCGPEIRSEQLPFYLPVKAHEPIKEYTNWLEMKYVEVIGSAIDNIEPASLTFSHINPVPFSVSRRRPTPEGIVYSSVPSSYHTGGNRDDTVPVLRVADTGGNVKAVLFGYACHPITLKIYKLCGDYPGFAQEYLEEAFPGATALFVQGCSGELVPNARFQLEYAMGHGKALADAVLKALNGEQTPLNGLIKSAYEEIELDLEPLPGRDDLEKDAQSDNESTKRKAAYFLKKLDNNENIKQTLTCPFQALQIGDELLMIGLCGEPVVDYAVQFKSEFSTRYTWVAGYNNHEFGYLPTWRILKEGGYEGGGAMRSKPYPGIFTETVESGVVDCVKRLVANMSK